MQVQPITFGVSFILSLRCLQSQVSFGTRTANYRAPLYNVEDMQVQPVAFGVSCLHTQSIDDPILSVSFTTFR